MAVGSIYKKITAISIIAAVLALLTLTSCGNGADSGQKQESKSFFAMDTYISITAYGESAESAIRSAQTRLTQLEKLWSVTDIGSDIYAINHSGGQPVQVSAETAELISFALQMSEKTGGALDPTIYPVLTAWGFTTDTNRVPGSGEIAGLLENVGYERVTVSGSSVQIGDGMMLDIGAVGKGYAGDIIAREMKESGVTSALIDLGGNIQLIGTKPSGEKWRIGVRDPKGGNVGVLSVSDCAVVTSGNYERFFTADDGTVYGHIIDPKTGCPVDNGLLSVTVIASEGRLCDALSTSLLVMGLSSAQDYLRQHRGEQSFDVIIVTDGGEIYLTKGIADSFSLDGGHSGMKIKIIE